MIRPFPNAAAHEILIFIEYLPIFLKSAGAYAHCMSVFAKEEGLRGVTLASCVFAASLDVCVVCIHFGYHVVAVTSSPDNALIVDGYLRAAFMQEVVALILAGISARLVAERPHDDACAASVALIHSLDSVKVSRRPLEVMADKVNVVVRGAAAAVSFDICFIYHIEAVNVAEDKESGVGGIVRSPDGVHVERLHQLYVFLKVVEAHNIAGLIVSVVMVDALDLDGFAVDGEYILFDLNGLEADIVTKRHNLVIASVKRGVCGVEGRYFGIP